MTFAVDKKHIKIQKSQTRLIDEMSYQGDAVSSMVVKPCSVSEVRRFISSYHYSKSMPDSTRFVFVGYYGSTIAGIVTYGMGSNHSQYTSLIPDIKKGEYVELTRLWSPDGMPKNTESHLISKSLHMLPDKIKLVVSFADPSQGHVGGIYQATNWLYCGMTNAGKNLIDSQGNVRHPKSISIYRKRHEELRDKSSQYIMDKYGWRHIPSSGKHRYVFLRGDRRSKRDMMKHLKIQSYPKRDKNQR